MPRHPFSCLAFGLALVLAAPAGAQQPQFSPSHLEAARLLVVTSGIAQTFESIYPEFAGRIRQNVVTRPELTKDLNEVIEALRPEFERRRDEMVEFATRVYAANLTEADMREVAAFFASPVGLRYNAARPQMIDQVFSQLQPWSIQTSNLLFTRVSEEMRKRGHQF